MSTATTQTLTLSLRNMGRVGHLLETEEATTRETPKH